MTALTDSDRRWIKCAGILHAAAEHVTREPVRAAVFVRLARDLIRRHAGPMELPGRWYELLRLAEVARPPAAELAADLWTLASKCLAQTERTA